MPDIAAAIVETMTQPVLVLEPDLTVALANRAFLDCFKVAAADTIGVRLDELGNGQWAIPALLEMLELLNSGVEMIENYRVEHRFETIGLRTMHLNGRRLAQRGHRRVLLAITDVTERERLAEELEGRQELANKLIDSIREGLVVVLTRDFRVQSVNDTFCRMFHVTPEETVSRLIHEVGAGQWDLGALRAALENVLPKQKTFDDFEVEYDFPAIGHRTMSLNARQLDHMPLILLAIFDVTERRHHEETQRLLVGELQHRVKNILAAVQAMAVITLSQNQSAGAVKKTFLKRLQSLARTQDLLLRGPDGIASLHDMVLFELAALGWEPGLRFVIEGPGGGPVPATGPGPWHGDPRTGDQRGEIWRAGRGSRHAGRPLGPQRSSR